MWLGIEGEEERRALRDLLIACGCGLAQDGFSPKNRKRKRSGRISSDISCGGRGVEFKKNLQTP